MLSTCRVNIKDSQGACVTVWRNQVFAIRKPLRLFEESKVIVEWKQRGRKRRKEGGKEGGRGNEKRGGKKGWREGERKGTGREGRKGERKGGKEVREKNWRKEGKRADWREVINEHNQDYNFKPNPEGERYLIFILPH